MSVGPSVEAISDRRHFASVADAWDNLARNQARPRLHVSADWLAAWWDCFGHEADVRIVVVREGGDLVVGLPLILTRKRIGGIDVPALRLLGNVYAPPMTPFLVEVERAGATAAGGITMLVYQGVVGFEMATGRDAPAELMLNAVLKGNQ